MLAKPHCAQTVESADHVFVSGQLAFNAEGRIEGDITHQTRICLEALETLLKSHGLTRRDVVKTTVWLRYVTDYPAFNAAYAEFFGEHRPARSTVTSALVLPEAIVEVEAIAAKPQTQPVGH